MYRYKVITEFTVGETTYAVGQYFDELPVEGYDENFQKSRIPEDKKEYS